MKKALLFILVLVLLWIIWANTGLPPELPAITPEISVTEEILSLPSDSIPRNIVGIQTCMLETDYLTQQQFQAKLNAYFKTAKDEGFFRENTIVLLPEYLGTWLVISGEKKSVANAGNLTWAMAQLVFSNPIQFQNFMANLIKNQTELPRHFFA